MKVMVGNKVIASVCSALVVASLLDVQADVVLPPHEGDLMMGHAHVGVQCIDGVCIPARVTNGFYPTRWRKWPIVPPAPAQRGVRERISPPTVDIPKSDVETEIPGRQGMPDGQPRRAPPAVSWMAPCQSANRVSRAHRRRCRSSRASRRCRRNWTTYRLDLTGSGCLNFRAMNGYRGERRRWRHGRWNGRPR